MSDQALRDRVPPQNLEAFLPRKLDRREHRHDTIVADAAARGYRTSGKLLSKRNAYATRSRAGAKGSPRATDDLVC